MSKAILFLTSHLHNLNSNSHHISLRLLGQPTKLYPKLHSYLSHILPPYFYLQGLSKRSDLVQYLLFSKVKNKQINKKKPNYSPVTKFLCTLDKVTSPTAHPPLLCISISLTTGHFTQVYAVLCLMGFYSSFQPHTRVALQTVLALGKSCLVFATSVLLQYMFRHFKYFSVYYMQKERIKSDGVEDGGFQVGRLTSVK